MVAAYTRFHELTWERRAAFPGLIDFGIADLASKAKGSLQWDWGVSSEICETINGINTWGLRLHEWAGWLDLLEESDCQMRLEIENHFVEPVAFFCMFQPPAIAERLLEVVENAIHQANCFVFPDVKDYLDQDELKPGQRFSIHQRRQQLDRLRSRWPSYQAFRDLWTQIDSASYRKHSRNFRNLSSHSFAPRFQTGQISRAPRSIVSASTLVKQPDGSYEEIFDPAQKCVSYALGVIEPLPFKAAYEANLKEYRVVQRTMGTLHKLITELVNATNARHSEFRQNKAEASFARQ